MKTKIRHAITYALIAFFAVLFFVVIMPGSSAAFKKFGAVNVFRPQASPSNSSSSTGTFSGAVTAGSIVTGKINSTIHIDPTVVSDVGASVNAACASSSNGVHIVLGSGSASYPTPININTNGTRCWIEGQGYSTLLTYIGASGTPAITINSGQQQDINPVLSKFRLKGLSATTTNPTTGVYIGGSNGASNAIIDNITVEKFGYNIRTGANAYNVTVQNSNIRGGGYNFYFNTASNSGEGIHLINNWIVDPGNNNPLNCIYADANSVASLEILSGSIDNCQVSAIDGNNININQVHFENPSPGTYGAYYFINIGLGSGNYTTVNLTNSNFWQASTATTTTPTSYVYNGGVFSADNITVRRSGSQGSSQSTSFVTNNAAGGGGTSYVKNIHDSDSALLSIVGTDGIAYDFGIDHKNKGVFGLVQDTSGNGYIYNGGVNSLLFDTYGNAAMGGTISTTTLLKITATKTYPTSISTGGMINITNTLNDGAGLVLMTNHGSGATGRPFQVNCNNSAFDQNCASIDMQGAAPALSISQSNTSSAIGNAANFASTNPQASSITVSGQEYSKGTIKITHTGNYLTDSNSAALSIDLQATSTPTGAKGIYMDSTTGASVGDLLDLRSYGTSFLKLNSSGFIGVGTATPDMLLVLGTQNTGIMHNIGIMSIASTSALGLEVNMQNKSSAATAYSEWCLSGDNSASTTYQTCFGHNNSTYNQSAYSIQGANAGYLLQTDGNLVLGTGSSTGGNLIFGTGGTLASNTRMVIDYRGYIAFGTTTLTSFFTVGGTSGSQFLVNAAGTVTAGTWNGNQIDVPHGGTGLGSAASGYFIVGTGGNGFQATSSIIIKSNGSVGIGTTTPTVMFQVATPSANATTSLEFGKSSQNKGTCLKMYDVTGTAEYCILTGTAFSCSTNSCQ